MTDYAAIAYMNLISGIISCTPFFTDQLVVFRPLRIILPIWVQGRVELDPVLLSRWHLTVTRKVTDNIFDRAEAEDDSLKSAVNTNVVNIAEKDGPDDVVLGSAVHNVNIGYSFGNTETAIKVMMWTDYKIGRAHGLCV